MMTATNTLFMRAITLICLACCLNVYAQDVSSTNSQYDAGKSNLALALKSLPLTFTTKAYRNEVSKLMLQEANKVAIELALNEYIPITISNLVDEHITPPRMANIGVGSVTTSNYIYYFSVGGKFSSVARIESKQEEDEIRTKYFWPIERIDTNSALQIATQWLKAVSVDVAALNRDCDTIVRAWTPEGARGKHFVPLYRIYWAAKGPKKDGSLAGVEFVMPTKSLQQLYVKKSQYLLRAPLVTTNIVSLLKTNNVVE